MSRVSNSQLTRMLATLDAGRAMGRASRGQTRAGQSFSDSLRTGAWSATASATKAAASPANSTTSQTAPAAQTESATTTADLGARSMDALKSACDAQNLSLAGCQVSYTNEVVWSPWGGYYNPQVNVTLPDGTLLRFGAELVAKSPNVTATELRHFMGLPPASLS